MVYMRNGFALVSVPDEKVSDWEKSGWTVDNNEPVAIPATESKPKTRRRKRNADTDE